MENTVLVTAALKTTPEFVLLWKQIIWVSAVAPNFIRKWARTLAALRFGSLLTYKNAEKPTKHPKDDLDSRTINFSEGIIDLFRPAGVRARGGGGVFLTF